MVYRIVNLLYSINWTSKGYQANRKRAACVTRKVVAEWLVIQRARPHQRRRACDSTGWPEGAKVTHDGHESHFSYSRSALSRTNSSSSANPLSFGCIPFMESHQENDIGSYQMLVITQKIQRNCGQ